MCKNGGLWLTFLRHLMGTGPNTISGKVREPRTLALTKLAWASSPWRRDFHEEVQGLLLFQGRARQLTLQSTCSPRGTRV